MYYKFTTVSRTHSVLCMPQLRLETIIRCAEVDPWSSSARRDCDEVVLFGRHIGSFVGSALYSYTKWRGFTEPVRSIWKCDSYNLIPVVPSAPDKDDNAKCTNWPTPCPEKRDQNVFCNISYKTRAIMMKFGT